MSDQACPICCTNREAVQSLITENTELRQHNEILARQISLLRSQIDTKELFSTYKIQDPVSSPPNLEQFESFCIQLVQKLEKHNVEMTRKRSFYEKELSRYRGLVSKLIHQLTRSGRSSCFQQKQKENSFDSAKKPARANASVQTVRSTSISTSTTAPRSINIKSIHTRQSYFSSIESEGCIT